MKAILMSIHPRWVKEIFVTKRKTIEVRKSAPKLEIPFTVYVYQTKRKGGKAIVNEVLNSVYGGGKVIGAFVCDRVENIFNVATTSWSLLDGSIHNRHKKLVKNACLTEGEIHEYSRGRLSVFAWHITEPKLFDKPREFYELYAPCKKNKQTADENCKGCVYAYKGTTTGEIYCDNALIRPPQSFCYVEDINEI